jgi:hypothetical protein
MGAQTFQAAQSYAEKAFLKSLFKLSTGEPDTETVMQATQEAPKKKKVEKLSETVSKSTMDKLCKELLEIGSKQDLASWVEDNSGVLSKMREDHQDYVRRAYAIRQGEIKEISETNKK